MGEELETYILKKLDDAIEESKDSKDFHLAAKFFLPKLHKEFIELKELILKKRDKIKAAAAAAKKESISGPTNVPAPARPRPSPSPAAENVTKIPDASKPSAASSSAVTAGAAGHDSSVPASTCAKDDPKALLPPAGDVKKSEAPRDAMDAGGDNKDTGTSLDAGGDKKDTGDAGDEKESGTPRDAGEKKDTGAPLDAGGDNKDTDTLSDAGGDEKDTGAPLDASSNDKESASDAKQTGAPSDAGDKKETGAPLDAAGDENKTDAPSVVTGDKKEIDTDVAGDKKESSAPSDATSDEKKTSSPLAQSAQKEADARLSGTTSKTSSPDSTPAKATVTSGGATDQHESDTHAAADGDKQESNVGTSANINQKQSQHESEISPATDDKSITPPASAGDGDKESNASKTATLAKTSTDKPEISPVTDDGAPDHKSKTLPTSAGGGKKEHGVSPADKSSTTVDAKPVNEEDLLREQLYYLNNVLTEWQMITKKPFSCSSDSVASVRGLSNTLKKIKQDLKPDPKKPDESSHSVIPPTVSSDNARITPEVVEFRWSTRLVNPKKVHGFEDKILSLERLLVLRRKDSDTFKAFGIHGMAGVGKTTLCQSIFSRPKVTGYFFPRIWVCLSKQKDEDEDNKKEVVKRMLRCLGIDDKIINKVDEKQGIRGLLFAVRLQLTGKRYFIVLDDAHNADEWFKMPDSDADNDNNKIYEKFSYGLPKECGGTVIVTSRAEQIVKNMVGDEENLRCIEPLTDENTCWNIFKDTVMEDKIPFPGDLEKLKLEIVKRCEGLPLAAKLLGQIKHKELRENPNLAGIKPAAGQAGN